MGRLLIIIYKNKKVNTREDIKEVGISTGADGQRCLFYEYKERACNPLGFSWEKGTIPLSDVKKIVYCGVTIWEAENAKN